MSSLPDFSSVKKIGRLLLEQMSNIGRSSRTHTLTMLSHLYMRDPALIYRRDNLIVFGGKRDIHHIPPARKYYALFMLENSVREINVFVDRRSVEKVLDALVSRDPELKRFVLEICAGSSLLLWLEASLKESTRVVDVENLVPLFSKVCCLLPIKVIARLPPI